MASTSEAMFEYLTLKGNDRSASMVDVGFVTELVGHSRPQDWMVADPPLHRWATLLQQSLESTESARA